MEPSAAGRYGEPSEDTGYTPQQLAALPASYVIKQSDNAFQRVIQNFTPSWFTVNMGTGVVSVLMYSVPYNGTWLYYISIILFCLNVALFVVFLLLSILRYAIWPELWRLMLRHPTQSLYIGAFPMALATILNMVVYVCVPAWGEQAITLAWALWWIDAAIAVATCVYLPFTIMSKDTGTQLHTMTATWLLPVTSVVIASGSGGIVAEVLLDPKHALWTLVISYIIWGISIPLTFIVLVIYFQRLTIHKLPAREVIVSVFLPMGPLGQGAFAAMQLGKVAQEVLPQTATLNVRAASDILYVVGWGVALILWGHALVWLFFAVASVLRSRFPFNMGWWGFVFPLGVYTLATITIGKEMPSTFFKVLGTILAIIITILWLVVAVMTLKGAVTGSLFNAPCLIKSREKDEDEPEDADVEARGEAKAE